MSDKWLITSNGQLLFFCLLCVSILLVSCERRDLTYYEVSEITLTADWNDSGLDDKEQKYGVTGRVLSAEWRRTENLHDG